MSNQDLIDYMNAVIAQTNETILGYTDAIASCNSQIDDLNSEIDDLTTQITQFQQNIIWATAIISLIPSDSK